MDEASVMAKNKVEAATREEKESQNVTAKAPQLRSMSLAKAKKLISKTSAEHQDLFRRLAK